MDCIPEEPFQHSEEDTSEFSSAASLSRQCTEFSDVVAQDLMSRQLTDFAMRQGDFWVRKCSEPVPFTGAKGLDSKQGDFRRQSSCPPLRSQGLFSPEPIEERESEEQESQGQLESEEEDDLVSRAICSAVADCDFSVAVADPTALDAELIAVSEGFERLTGYLREEAVGCNCRFLSEGCPPPDLIAQPLREATDTGAPYSCILVNKRKTGHFFLNLLSLRGLVVARHAKTGEEIWILVAVQQDVTGVEPDSLPSSDALLSKVAGRILRRLLKYATEIGIASLIEAKSRGCGMCPPRGQVAMQLLSDVIWKSGDPLGLPTAQALELIPSEFVHLAFQAPPALPEGKASKVLIWPFVVCSTAVAVLLLLLQRKRAHAAR